MKTGVNCSLGFVRLVMRSSIVVYFVFLFDLIKKYSIAYLF